MLRRITITCLLGLGCLLSACSSSADRNVYHSTPWSPKTIMVRDTLSHKIIWEKDIPVNHRLVLDFDRPGDYPPFRISHDPAKEMIWSLTQDGTKKLVEQGRFQLQGVSILISMKIRESPEHPSGYVSPTDDVGTAVPPDAPELPDIAPDPVEDVSQPESPQPEGEGGQEDLLEEILAPDDTDQPADE